MSEIIQCDNCGLRIQGHWRNCQKCFKDFCELCFNQLLHDETGYTCKTCEAADTAVKRIANGDFTAAELEEEGQQRLL